LLIPNSISSFYPINHGSYGGRRGIGLTNGVQSGLGLQGGLGLPAGYGLQTGLLGGWGGGLTGGLGGLGRTGVLTNGLMGGLGTLGRGGYRAIMPIARGRQIG